MSLRINGLGGGLVLPRRQANGDRPPPTPEQTQEQRPPPTATDGLVAEQRRAELASVHQTLGAMEDALTMVRIALAALATGEEWVLALKRAMTRLGQLPPGKNRDEQAAKVGLALGNLVRLAEETRFGSQALLNGALGTTGFTQGPGLRFVEAKPGFRPSPAEGYAVEVRRFAQAARIEGLLALPNGPLQHPVTLTLESNGQGVMAKVSAGAYVEALLLALEQELKAHGLPLRVGRLANGRLWAAHRRAGHHYGLRGHSQPAGILSTLNGDWLECFGSDAAGHIDGQEALGQGPLLGLPGQDGRWGLTLAHYPEPGHTPPLSGRVFLSQKGLLLRWALAQSGVTRVAFPSLLPEHLGLGGNNLNLVSSLANLVWETPDAAEDSLEAIELAHQVILRANQQLSWLLQGELVQMILQQQMIVANMQAVHSAIHHGDFAQEVAHYLRDRLEADAPLALSAQVRPLPGATLRLLGINPDAKGS